MAVDQLLFIFLMLAGFYMAWNIGANDVSNAMGTSVGSRSLTLLKAVIIAGILEFAGAFFLGSHVSQTLQKGIVDPAFFAGDPKILVYGMLSALLATASWLQIASFFGWPVSTTHAIVGAILGFGSLVGGMSAIHWEEVGSIACSWMISPALSALFSFLLFTLLQRKILYALHPVQATRKLIPYLTFFVFAVFTLTSLLHGLGSFHFYPHPLLSLLIALLVGILGGGSMALFIKRVKFPPHTLPTTPSSLPHQVYSLNKALKHLKRVQLSATEEDQDAIRTLLTGVEALTESKRAQSGFYTKTTDYQMVEKMFSYLQVLSASYVAFAHGANDVANAIGPVAAALEILQTGKMEFSSSIPTWLLFLGGIGIVIGLATWGWRVIETIGKKITELTPTRGFSAEFGAAVTILAASQLGLPISTTHCIVGSVLGVGLARGISALNLRVLRDIVLSWVITLPCCALSSILIFYLIRFFFG